MISVFSSFQLAVCVQRPLIFAGGWVTRSELPLRSRRGKRRVESFEFSGMDGNGIAAFLLLILVAADVPNATSFGKITKFIHEAPNRNDTATQSHVSPPASPIGSSERMDPLSANPEEPTKISSKSDPKVSNKADAAAPPTQNVKEKGNNSKHSNETAVATPQKAAVAGNDLENTDNVSSTTPSSQEKKDGGNNKEKEEGDDRQGDEDKSNSQPGTGETCKGVPKRCRDQNSLVACIRSFENGSKELVVQNEGEQNLTVNLRIPTNGEYRLKKLKIQKKRSKKMIMSGTVTNANTLILSAGSGNCVLHMDPPVSDGNFFIHMPSYTELLTPVNGAYFLIATTLIFVGTWACCKFRSRRQQDGIPYQELEMGLPDSVSATEVETAEGWDQGWDDDWDDENAMKPPPAAVRHAGSISFNGLTSRSSNKDGWEDGWDDRFQETTFGVRDETHGK